MNLSLAFRIAALVCFILAVVGIPVGVALVPLGLALWVASTLP